MTSQPLLPVPEKPLSITIRGEFFAAVKCPDLALSITRVDGRTIWQERLSAAGPTLTPGQVHRHPHTLIRSSYSRRGPLPPRCHSLRW